MYDRAVYQPTSERVSEDHYQQRTDEYRVYLFHLATYDFAIPYVGGRRVLDFGCGTGYGDRRIAGRCASLVAVDVSSEAIGFARDRYQTQNLTFQIVPPVERSPLPFPDGSFDVVLSFQVIEHVPDADLYLSEARRVLSDEGVMILATPDRTHRLLPGQRPWNRHHLVEYAPDGLADLLRVHFTDVECYGMGGAADVVGPELARSRRLKWGTLPFTFPGAPESWRQWGLSALKRLEGSARARSGGARVTDGSQGEPAGVDRSHSKRYDETSIRIARDVRPSVNIVAVARR